MSEEEIAKLKEDYHRAMEGLLKIDHIIEAFMSVASPNSKPYAEVLLKVVKEARGETNGL